MKKSNDMNATKRTICLILAALLLPLAAGAQQVLTLDECRDRAIGANKGLDQARTRIEMAGYDRKIARANYFPNVSATGAYLYNNRELCLIPESMSELLTTVGTTGVLPEYLPKTAEAVHRIGQEVDDALTLDIRHVTVGAVTVQQPVFVGGKIVLSNQMAALAEELARSQYDMKYADIVVEVDQAYWQIVSIAAKKRLAENYADLLHQLEHDVAVSVAEGVATQSDALQIKVKANEADMMLTKATNGLILAKMLLCKEVGLPLDSDIVLADEALDAIPLPEMAEPKDLGTILCDRPETRSLDLAVRIYDKKARIARADMMPKVLLVANYLVSNPNMYHSFQNTWNGGMFSAGVLVNVPIFHGLEAQQKTRKARAEVALYRDQLEEAGELINLQVEQSRQHYAEALEKLGMAESNLAHAEENMRTATVGFEAGVINTTTVLGAQTAWLSAQSEYIDAGVDVQMAAANIEKAEGRLVPATLNR